MEDKIVRWQKERKSFFLKLIIFSLLFFLSLPIGLGLFPNFFLKQTPLWSIPLSWLYAILQVFVTWIICFLYWKKAKYFDELIAQYKQEDTE